MKCQSNPYNFYLYYFVQSEEVLKISVWQGSEETDYWWGWWELGDTSTIGISIPAKNIITFSIRISLLCWAQGEHFPRKSFSIWIESLLRGVMIGMIVMMTIAKLMSVLSKRMEFFWQYFQLLCFSVTRTTLSLTLCESLFSLNLSKQHCLLWFKYQFTCQT